MVCKRKKCTQGNACAVTNVPTRRSIVVQSHHVRELFTNLPSSISASHRRTALWIMMLLSAFEHREIFCLDET